MKETSKILITYKEACERYSLSLSTVQRLAKKINAIRKVGKCARIDVQAMDAYIATLEG